MGTEVATATCFVGIDVSEDTLDACLMPSEGKTKEAQFANTAKGHAALAAWADRHAKGAAPHFCMEATGPYSEALATHLADAGPPAPEVRELQALVRRVDDLVEMAAREKGRLASPALTTSARRSITRTVEPLEKEADRLRAEADELIAGTEALAADRALLESIPGVGRQTATTILAEPAVERLPSAESAAAYCGLAPREFQSGTSQIWCAKFCSTDAGTSIRPLGKIIFVH